MKRPSFSAAWAASLRIYNPADSAEQVAQVIGGEVAANIRDKRNPWRNTCAVRMSYILNQAGVPVPNIPGKTKKGGDHHNDFYRIRDVIAFLKSHWGAPEVVAYPQPEAAISQGRRASSSLKCRVGVTPPDTRRSSTEGLATIIATLTSPG